MAVGDAIGSRWEWLPADMIYDMGPADQIVMHAEGETIYYTDDTQMMMSVAEAIIDDGTIRNDSLLRRFADKYDP